MNRHSQVASNLPSLLKALSVSGPDVRHYSERACAKSLGPSQAVISEFSKEPPTAREAPTARGDFVRFESTRSSCRLLVVYDLCMKLSKTALTALPQSTLCLKKNVPASNIKIS